MKYNDLEPNSTATYYTKQKKKKKNRIHAVLVERRTIRGEGINPGNTSVPQATPRIACRFWLKKKEIKKRQSAKTPDRYVRGFEMKCPAKL